jgi:5-methylcytosine-specific restriction endonuclease McrA
MEALRRDGFRCRRCRKAGTFWGEGQVRCSDLHVAHVVPLGRGRSRYQTRHPINGLPNLATLCPRCHDLRDRCHAWQWDEIGVTPDWRLRRPCKAA